MTIALRAAGTATAATAAVTAVNPAVPSGAQAGDLSILTVAVKPYNTTLTTPSGWTKIGEHTNGTTAAGTDTGSMKIALYVRESASVGAIGNIGQSGANSMGAVIHVYSRTLAAWDFSSFTQGFDDTNGINYSATGDAGINVAAGDWVFAGTAGNGDVGAVTAGTIGGMSGATLGTVVDRTNAEYTTGTDSRLTVGDVPITAGSSSAAPTCTYTNASNSSGTTMWLRLRETGGVTATPSAIASAEAFGTSVVTVHIPVAPTGLASDETFGAPTISMGGGATNVAPVAITSAETFGTPALALPLTASPGGIGSAETFGASVLSGTLAVSATGVATAVAFGSPATTTPITLAPAGLDTGAVMGTLTVSGTVTLSPSGVATGAAVGAPTLALPLTMSPSGVLSGAAFGIPTLITTWLVAPTGIPTSEAFGFTGSGFTIPAHRPMTASPATKGLATAQAAVQQGAGDNAGRTLQASAPARTLEAG